VTQPTSLRQTRSGSRPVMISIVPPFTDLKLRLCIALRSGASVTRQASRKVCLTERLRSQVAQSTHGPLGGQPRRRGGQRLLLPLPNFHNQRGRTDTRCRQTKFPLRPPATTERQAATLALYWRDQSASGACGRTRGIAVAGSRTLAGIFSAGRRNTEACATRAGE